MNISVIGHFGTRYSYARIAREIESALGAPSVAALGRTFDMDPVSDRGERPGFVESEGETKVPPWTLTRSLDRADSAVLIVPPREQVDAFLKAYPGRVSLLVCPNTDAMEPRLVERIARFSHLIVPSLYCHEVVCRSLERAGYGEHPEPVIAPLGIGTLFADAGLGGAFRAEDETFTCPLGRRRDRQPGDKVRFLHLSSDWFLPGRKGTEALIDAWLALSPEVRQRCELTMHVPAAIAEVVFYMAGDKGLTEPELMVRTAARTGTRDEDLVALMAAHDVLVQPARCEGFGMMPLAAQAMGMPVIATETRQWPLSWREPMLYSVEFRTEGPHGKGDVLVEDLQGEYGKAPVVDVESLAYELGQAARDVLSPEKVVGVGISAVFDEPPELTLEHYRYTWPVVSHAWAKMLTASDEQMPWRARSQVSDVLRRQERSLELAQEIAPASTRGLDEVEHAQPPTQEKT